MDADYGRNRDRDGAPTKTFEPSLFVWATVMSRPTEDRAIVDAGLKALAFDSGPPTVWDEPAATYERASDEHGRLAVSTATNRLRIGDKIRLIPGHCDPTVNLYDWYVGIRGNRVEQLWPITARGAVYSGSSPGHPCDRPGPDACLAVPAVNFAAMETPAQKSKEYFPVLRASAPTQSLGRALDQHLTQSCPRDNFNERPRWVEPGRPPPATPMTRMRRFRPFTRP
jgi:hypothetical protein